MAESLPFSVEYAKSNRSSCKKCRNLISQDSVRIAVMVQSPHFDGMQPLWHHSTCFWLKTAAKRRAMAETDFKGLANLRWEDQEAVRSKIGAGVSVDETDAADVTTTVSDFAVELAKSGRATCRVCSEKIGKAELRVSVKERTGGRSGSAWHHLGCFAASLERLNFTFKPEEIPGFEDLDEADQKTVSSTVKPLKRQAETNGNNQSSKKAKKEEPKMDEEKAKMKEQSDAMWKIRDELRQLTKAAMGVLLTHNGQEIPVGEAKIMDRLSDVIYFGPLKPCVVCKNGQLVFSTSIHTYRCMGHLSEWSKCQATVDDPARGPFKVPVDILEDCAWLNTYIGASGRSRILPTNRPDPTASVEQLSSQAASSIASTADKGYAASSRKSSGASGGKSYASSAKSAKYTVKNGAAVEDCEVADFTHVYRDAAKGGTAGQPWTAVLNSVDVSRGSNSFYKLQLLQHDRTPKRFYLFRAWGRVGTTIGGTKVEDFHDLQDAKDVFEQLYLEKSGNMWSERDSFVKRPGKLYPVEVDYGEAAVAGPLVTPGSKSLLPNPVKELIKLIFDVDAMKDTMMQFEIDLTKMPLGKLSKNRIKQAYSVLTDLQNMMGSSGGVPEPQAVDASNRFYTLVPHDFGMEKPTLLRTAELIRTKTDMLDALMEIEVAYSILQSARDSHEEDPIDAQYKGLDSNIHPLEKSSSEYKMLAKYVANTHAPTHTMYRLEVEEIFRVERAGEAAAFAGGVGNRALLWHGSRTSNYAGILAQGLRIAPPEAPVTGYMFGKGVYFADMLFMFSDYCHAPRDGPGLLMLCDVALGESWELKKATMVTPAMLKKEKKHSTKGLGRTAPNPASDVVKDGVRIPLGKSVDTNIDGTTLLYNEFIVYDVNQVNIKYLFRTKFVYK